MESFQVPNPLLKETGLVTKVEGDVAWVNTASKLACSSCKVESTCGNGILEKYLAGKVFVSKINNSLQANVGDKVEIAIPRSSITKASMIVYFVPLVGLILGALIGQNLFNSEATTIVSSIGGFILGLAVTHFYNQRLADSQEYQPKMVSKVTTNFVVNEFNSIKVKNL